MNSPEIKEFIKENNSLFWYTPEKEKENISEELLVETILNYGDMEAVKRLFSIMSTGKVAIVFFGLQGRKKLNYYPEIYNFFSLYLKKNA